MPRCITGLFADFAVPSNVTAVSESASFPATNAALVSYPNTPYKSGNTIALTERLVYDFGSATSLPAIILDHINVGSVVLKGNATNSWASPSWSSGTVTVNADGKDGRRKLYHAPSGSGSPFNYRYLALEPATTTTTDGSTLWRVGSMLGLKVATQWPLNFAFPYRPQQQRAIDPVIRQGGGGEPSARGNRYATITIPASRYNDPAMEALLDAIVAQQDKPLVFFRNFGNSAEVYICHLISQPAGPSLIGPNLLQMDAMIFREMA